MLQPIHKATVLKKVREHRSWKGYIAPSNVNAYHITEGWHLGVSIEIRKDNFHYFVWNGTESMPLDAYLANFEAYNCNGELGKRVRFWE